MSHCQNFFPYHCDTIVIMYIIMLHILTDVFALCVVQVVSQYSGILSPIAVDAVLRVIDPAVATNVDLKDIKIVKKIG